MRQGTFTVNGQFLDTPVFTKRWLCGFAGVSAEQSSQSLDPFCDGILVARVDFARFRRVSTTLPDRCSGNGRFWSFIRDPKAALGGCVAVGDAA